MAELETRPPPVPPKDTPQRYSDRLEHSSASAAKRKHLATYADESDLDNDYETSPKRHRLTPSADDSPQRQNTLRRKKGVNNLSTLSLRHEAERARLEETARESRFQEGSLTDKPSQRPPSAYISFTPLEHVDTLMADYHDGMPTPDDSVHDVDSTQHSNVSAEQPSVLYRFGQKLAASFRPAAMLSKFWQESKEDLIQKTLEAAQKKRQKEEAERQYALMQQAGQIPKKRSSYGFGSVSQRDSGIAMFDGHSSKNSSAIGLSREGASSRTGASSRAESHTGNEQDSEKTLRGRLHFKRPSLSNLRMKRTRSDANLFGSKHDSSASMSPVKTDEEHTLQKSPSKADLRKQRKLSKRVSDLELQLHIARQELNEAIVEASPLPQTGRYPRSAAARKFVPGLLPSLPSERLLMAEALEQDGSAKRYDDETIRASRVNYPRRAADLFDEYDSDDEPVGRSTDAAVKRLASTADMGNQATGGIALDGSKDSTNLRKSLMARDDVDEELSRSATSKKRKSMEQHEVQEDRAEEDGDVDLDDTASRLSIDSTTRSLEPVYEEEEDTVNIPLNGDPAKPTATATPARFGRFTRSMSPVKHSNVRPGAEEVVMTRAAEVARQHPGRQTSRSPAKDQPFEWPADVF